MHGIGLNPEGAFLRNRARVTKLRVIVLYGCTAEEQGAIGEYSIFGSTTRTHCLFHYWAVVSGEM